MNLIQSSDYLQVQGEINSSFFDISQLELEELEDKSLEGLNAADVFLNFVGTLLLGSEIDEESIMGTKWVGSLINDTALWTAVEAKKYLNLFKIKKYQSRKYFKSA